MPGARGDVPQAVDGAITQGDGGGTQAVPRAEPPAEPARAQIQGPVEPASAVAVAPDRIVATQAQSPVDRPAASELDGRPDQPDRPVDGLDSRPVCTTAQLRRFIKSRPWIPMHELRRRFGITGDDDGVSPLRVANKTLFIGLPPAEARLMGELLGSGDVGYELSLDPVTPVVVGVYPMRPVPRG